MKMQSFKYDPSKPPQINGQPFTKPPTHPHLQIVSFEKRIYHSSKKIQTLVVFEHSENVDI